MSLLGLGMVLLHVAVVGLVHEADEGTPAHVFYILMVAQAPIAAYFAIKWFPK